MPFLNAYFYLLLLYWSIYLLIYISLAWASASLKCLRLVAVYGSIGVSLIQGFVITHEFIPSPEVILYPNEWIEEGKCLGQINFKNFTTKPPFLFNYNFFNSKRTHLKIVFVDRTLPASPVHLKGQLAKWKFTSKILVTVDMGQNITIHPRISSGAPSVRALELKQN